MCKGYRGLVAKCLMFSYFDNAESLKTNALLIFTVEIILKFLAHLYWKTDSWVTLIFIHQDLAWLQSSFYIDEIMFIAEFWYFKTASHLGILWYEVGLSIKWQWFRVQSMRWIQKEILFRHKIVWYCTSLWAARGQGWGWGVGVNIFTYTLSNWWMTLKIYLNDNYIYVCTNTN